MMEIDLTIILSVLAIALLLILSAIFSGSETSLTAASRSHMHMLERQGSKRARIVNRLMNKRERLIGAILLGNNLVNILASALATSILITAFGDAGVAYATIIMTALVLIFAEVLPKTYALRRTNALALAVAPILRPLVFLLAPITRSIEVIVGLTLRVFGVGRGETGPTAAEELRGTLAMHGESGEIVKSERDMLDSILDLSDVDVSDIMVHRRNMVMIDSSRSPSEIVGDMLQSPFTRVPLWRDDVENIVGVLHARDLLKALAEAKGKVDQINPIELCRTSWFVPETTTLREQLTAFRERREHFALVVDEYGALMGLVTLEDILEEIVGDIADEHDHEENQAIRLQGDGSYVVEGMVSIRDLNRHCDWDLPEDEAATIAGLVIHEAQRLPEIGEEFSFLDFDFRVMRRQRNQITLLRIHPPVGEES
jgi:magnesium and cobalt exporter, CNNM family